MTEAFTVFLVCFGIGGGISLVIVTYNVLMAFREYWLVRMHILRKEAESKLDMLEGMNR